MNFRKSLFPVSVLILSLALVPGALAVAEDAAATAAESQPAPLDFQALLDAPLTPAATAATGTLADTLNKGPKPVGLCANNGCATTCRDDADCGPGGNCIYTACL